MIRSLFSLAVATIGVFSLGVGCVEAGDRQWSRDYHQNRYSGRQHSRDRPFFDIPITHGKGWGHSDLVIGFNERLETICPPRPFTGCAVRHGLFTTIR